MDMSFVLDTFDEIIEHVLNFIPGKQLNELMNINSHWREAARRVLRRRTKPDWLQWNDKEGPIMTCYSNFIDETYAVPNTIVTFSSMQVLRSTCCHRHKCPTKKRKIDFDIFLKQETPVDADSVVIFSYGNVGMAGMASGSPGSLKHFTSASATSIFWPKRGDLTVKVVPSFEDLRLGPRSSPNEGEQEGSSLKLLMAFCTERCIIEDEVWPIDCPVAGCRVSFLKYNGNNHSSLCLAFFGKKNVEVASVVVPPTHTRPEEVEKKLMEFVPFLRRKFCSQDCGGSSNNSSRNNNSSSGSNNSSSNNGNNHGSAFDAKKFSGRIHGYLFSCVDRVPAGSKTNVDLASFAKVFPGVPLFGLSGYGEIGMDVMVAEDGEADRSSNGRSEGFAMKDHMHVVSSVFVLVTF